jgi:hypothetical protein
VYVSTSPFAQYDNDAINLYINTPPNLFRSTNGGTSFDNVKSNLPDRFVMDFAINPRNQDSVWIVLGGYGTSHVYLSADGGNTWINKGLNLPDVPHNAIMLDPRNPKYVYVGNDLGVYVSPDYGATWYDFNNGLWDATLVMDLVATSNGKMVAATHGKGAFITDLYAAGLPLTLISFTGNKHDHYNTLLWVTGMEQNVSHFEVERSVNGVNYTTISNVPAKNIATGSSYSFNDPLQGISQADNAYYRLKMVDIDGQFSYSGIILLRANPESDLVVTNPFSNKLTITFTSSQVQTVKIDLYDAKGRWLMRRIITVQTGINNLELHDIQSLASGNYILQLSCKDIQYTRKLVKQ